MKTPLTSQQQTAAQFFRVVGVLILLILLGYLALHA